MPRQPTDRLNLLTSAEVCEMLQVSSATLWRMVQRGDLEPYRLGPRAWRFSRRDVDAYLERLLAPYRRFLPSPPRHPARCPQPLRGNPALRR